MSPGSPEGVLVVVKSLRAADLGFLSVQACKPAWLWDKLAFFDPCARASCTDAKSRTCVDSTGLCTLAHLETSESVRARF
jgi:hypothetical protein